LKNLPAAVEGSVIRGLQSATLRMVGVVTDEIDNMQLVDMGDLRRSVTADMSPRGGHIEVKSPHAAPIENGTRPFMPPIKPLEEWVKRKGLHLRTRKEDSNAKSIAWAIAMKFKKYGMKPRHYFKTAWQQAPQIAREEVNRELAKFSWDDVV